MHRIMLISKIHRAVTQEVNLDYEGSVAIDEEILNAADIFPYQQVQVYNINTGVRFETYAITGEAGSGKIAVNGAASRLVHPGDLLIIAAYGLVEEEQAAAHKPKVVLLDRQNRIVTAY